MKRVLGYLRRADEDHKMITENDKVAVGLSGGKDSMLLLYALHLYKHFSRNKYEISAFTVDLGFESFDPGAIESYCRSLGIKHTIIVTDIAKIVFDIRHESNPCSLCSKLRKGALFTEMKRQGFTKCAFAHHREDCLESFLLSLLFEGRLRTFAPVTHLSRQGITLIRPFIYVPEKDVKGAIMKHRVPVISNPCPVNGSTKRQEIKKLLAAICASSPDAREKMLTAIKNTRQYSLWDKP
jgi:tRNA 2-thiocytidine biosynthesis protein TtcA